MESTSQTFCLDGNGGIDQSQTRPLSPDSRADSTWLHAASQQKEAENIVQLILGHYTSQLGRLAANPI